MRFFQLPASVLLTCIAYVNADSTCCGRYAGFDPVKAAGQAQELSRHSWEYGTTAEALLELYSPRLTVRVCSDQVKDCKC